MRSSQYAFCLVMLALLLGEGATSAVAAPPSQKAAADVHWVATWGAAQQIPEPQNMLAPEEWREASLRQIVHVSIGGTRVRVRISNAFGTTPLLLESASIAKSEGAGKAGIDVRTVKALMFSGKAGIMIPAGAEYYSDPLPFELAPASDLAISMYFKGEPVRQTGHPGSRATSFVTRGNRVLDAAWPGAGKTIHWFQLSDVEVEAPRRVGALAAIGDSITDGHGATTDGNDRWPDQLAARLMREMAPGMGVVNTGIGGGRMLRDGLGPNLVSRFERDVLTRSGVTHAIVLIGVNDLGGQHRNTDDLPEARARMLEDLKTAFQQIVERAHLLRVCVIGATLTPYVGSDYYRPNADNESDRQVLNKWIRTSGVFDGVADFDAVMRDPARPERMRTTHDTGDGLHPSPTGFRAMADAVPLAALRPCF